MLLSCLAVGPEACSLACSWACLAAPRVLAMLGSGLQVQGVSWGSRRGGGSGDRLCARPALM